MIAQRRKKMAVTHPPKISTLLLREASPEPKTKVDQPDNTKKNLSKNTSFMYFDSSLLKNTYLTIMLHMRQHLQLYSSFCFSTLCSHSSMFVFPQKCYITCRWHMNKPHVAQMSKKGTSLCDFDSNNMFYLLRYQINANLCAHSSFLIHHSPSRSFSSYLPQYWLHLLNSASLSDALDDR